jgi:propionate CoA-transferase
MELIEITKLVAHLATYKLTQKRYDIDYRPAWLESDKFISAREAVQQVSDNATVISTGMASHARGAIFYWAFRDVHKKKKTPKDLTWITVSAQGGRGKAPGTIEELGVPGLLKEYICGHVETAKSLLDLGDKGHLEIHTLPQGEITALLVAQARGEATVESKTGVGTFYDPELGGTTAITLGAKKSYISRNNGCLSFTMPKVEAAFMVAPYADREGNIYFRHAATITENVEAAEAAYKNGGKVFVTVSDIIEKNESEIRIPKEWVTGIVVNPWNEQTGAVRQKEFWPLFTEGARVDTQKAVKTLKLVNKLARITPARGAVENTMARMAASLFTKEAKKGDLINLGIGLPEEVGRLIYEGGLHHDLTFSSETGALGGIPTPGLYFGGAINPIKLNSSAWMFDHYKNNLDMTVLGILQVDSEGNVNVSKRGKRVSDYVGPGGFMNIASSAKKIIFLGSFMAKASFKLRNGKLRIAKKGIPKFVDTLNEVTFNAKEALKQGKKVYYVTTVGIFRLTEQGVELYRIMPGIDIRKDIIANSTARIIVPDHVETVTPDIVTGMGYKLSWPEG